MGGLLKRHQVEVVSASSGEEAIALIESTPDRFDLLVTDIVMPGVKGTEVARKMREVRPDTPVLIMSGYADPELVGEVEDAEYPLLPKPFSPTRLLAEIGDLRSAKVA